MSNVVVFPWEKTSYGRASTVEKSDQDAKFVKRAYDLIVRMANKRESLHVNDFWDEVDRLKKRANSPWHTEPSDRRLLGKAFRQAAREGIIANSGLAKRSDRHGNYYRPVWISNVYKR